MISKDSPLKKLSARTDRKQAMIFDGIRHAAEIAHLAYSRLRDTLTLIAINELSQDELDFHTTTAFLDAWAYVDATDRFRILWKQVSNGKKSTTNLSEPTLDDELQSIRNLRNVADHIAQRIDEMVSKRSSALGSISWITITDIDSLKGLVCAIIPGTLRNNKLEILYPRNKIFEAPTGSIHLDAGAHKACLCDTLIHIETRIRKLEKMIAVGNAQHSEDEEYAASDVLIKFDVQFNKE